MHSKISSRGLDIGLEQQERTEQGVGEAPTWSVRRATRVPSQLTLMERTLSVELEEPGIAGSI